MFRFWVFMAGVCNIAAVVAIAGGATVGQENGGQHFAAQALVLGLLNVPLLGIAALLAATDGRRLSWATWSLNIAASAYLVSILISSFLVFPVVDAVRVSMYGFAAMGGPVTFAKQVSYVVLNNRDILGGIAASMFVVAWVALGASSFGFKRLGS